MQISSKGTIYIIGSNCKRRGERELGGQGRGKGCIRKSFLPVPQVVHLLGSLPLQSRQVWWHKWHCPLNSNFPLGHCIMQRPSSKTLLRQRGIITSLASTCSLSLIETNKKLKIFSLHFICKSLWALLFHFPDLIYSIY